MNCSTIHAGMPFLDALAVWLMECYGPDALPKALVLLPNRRACRSLREAFLRIGGGKPMLLPRLAPIGELETEIPAFHGEIAELPPVIAPVRRHLLLTQLVMDFEKKRQGRMYDVAQAASLARQLAQFLDDMAREALDFEGLKALVPQELAVHWQQTLDFLSIISHHWPKMLAAEGVIDPVTHRNLLLKAVAKNWQAHPPEHPVIAAGSTGSQPAVAALLAVISRMEHGRVILPALDTEMLEEDWEQIAETHPQYALKTLLECLKYKRDEVNTISLLLPLPLGEGWGEGGAARESLTPTPLPEGEGLRQRISCLRTILAPPEATSRWREFTLPPGGLTGLRIVEADTLQDEARMIAVALREALETPGKTAALVTQDRKLARMVAAQLRRFGVAIDDSAGRAIKDIPAACFLRLAIEMIASQASPAGLLALLRHPLAAAGMETAECRRLSRLLELQLLRGIRKTPGLEALCDAADSELKKILDALVKNTAPLAKLFLQKSVSLKTLLDAHLAFAEWLATTDTEDGSKRLWAGEGGRALALHIAELAQHAELLAHIDPLSYPALFESLLAEENYWPSYGMHPRLHLLSPMEARLQHFDLAILGGLNEGSWPTPPAPDPWMSRPMRKAFGLPPLERAIGQSAHDFMQLCASPEALLTRARKTEGAATVPSRWLVRMKTLLGEALPIDRNYERAIAQLDAPLDIAAITAPMPLPPVSARPRKLRVTEIDQWLRDPYLIYAARILNLRALKPLDQEPGAADFGSIVHKALERFVNAYPHELPEDVEEQLLASGREAFAETLDRPSVACLWWPRFEAMAAWLVVIERERRRSIDYVLAELKSEWHFDVDGKNFTLTTRIDRLEIHKGSHAAIIDYKTGTLPSASDIARGLANQLPLEALIAMQSPLPIGGGNIILEYWRLSGNEDNCDIVAVDAPLEETRERLVTLIRRFDDPATPYAAQNDPSLVPRYNDYAHLTRRQEWGEF